MTGRLEVLAIPGVPEIQSDDELGSILRAAASSAGWELAPSDVVVVSHKAVAKAEGRVRALAAVSASPRADELAQKLGKDPRLVQLVLDESRAVLRAERGRLIVETHSGWVCANAGIDASNLPGEDTVALLPHDGDASARRIRAELGTRGQAPAVVIADSFGRAWRLGQADVAIGCAGLAPLDDWRGRPDAHGRELAATVVAIADEVAAAADLVRDKDSGSPAAVVRGLERYVTVENGPGAAALHRPEAEDLFR